MGNTGRDPVDHSRTTRKRAGETMKNTVVTPGLFLGALSVVAFVICLFVFATGHTAGGVVAAVLTVLAGVASVVWVLIAHRRVARIEAAYLADHPEADSEPPTA